MHPEILSITLFGPGVYAVTNQNSEMDKISGCIFKLPANHFQISEKDELKLLYLLYR